MNSLSEQIKEKSLENCLKTNEQTDGGSTYGQLPVSPGLVKCGRVLWLACNLNYDTHVQWLEQQFKLWNMCPIIGTAI